MNNNTNTNEIKIDLGGLGDKKEDKETNIALLMMMKDAVPNIYCPVCDDKRMTKVSKHMTTGGYIYFCIMLFIFWPAACSALCDQNNWGHTRRCTVCNTKLYSKE